MATLIILLIFSSVSTFVFRRSANIFDRPLRNLFLLPSGPISSSNSSWAESEIDESRSRTPSVVSLSSFSFVNSASRSLLISSNNRACFS